MNGKRFRIAWTIYAFGLLTAVYAQQPDIGIVEQIRVEGNEASQEYVIRLSSGLKEGQSVVWDDIQSAIRSLWATGIFSDIRILVEPRSGNKIDLIIRVEEYPRLERIIIEGNRKIKTENILKELGLFRGQVINRNQVTRAEKTLFKMYAEKGYTLAEISTETIPAQTQGRALLTVSIEEGPRVQIERIRFFGNRVINDRKLRKQMKSTRENAWWRGADFDKELYKTDLEKILEYYRNSGYRDAEITRDSLYYNDTQEEMYIDIFVNEGQKYYIGDITWEGNELFSDEELGRMFDLKKGDVYSQKKFDESLHEKINGAYYDFGYVRAMVAPRETLRGGDTLNIHFNIVENDPVTVRKIIVTGNHRTKDRVILREMRILPGQTFRKDLLVRSARDLMVLNYFSNVIPNPMLVGEDEMDLVFTVEEKSTDTANLAAGWSELDRLIGSVGLSMNNLFGNGQQFSLNWNFGRYYRALNVSFTEPWFRNTPTLVGLSVYDTKRDPFYIGYSQKSTGFSVRLGRRLRWPDNYFRGDWIYRLDRTALGDFSDYYIQYNPNNIVNEKWPLTTSGMTQIITRNSLDHPEFPTRGSRASLSTEITGGPFGGNVGYHKHLLKVEFFMPVVSPRIVLLARAQAGFMETLTSESRIPYLDYFFIGGSGMSRSIPLRGYDDPLAGGRYTGWGGKTLLQATLEMRFPILQKPTAFGLLFAEAGNTWLDLRHTDPFDLKRSLGVGLRMYMPMVGMIGIDYGYGFDNYIDGKRVGAWRPQFVFGRGF
ncbi:MAG TPA: outer membrane protein assembly factor BamA [bacterium]|nr:outer membrane protein assembly factor BamA [bacterium]